MTDLEKNAIGSLFAHFDEERRLWSYETFGHPSERDGKGPLNHLKREIEEVLAEDNIEKRCEEYADCFFLLLDASSRDGMSLFDLVVELRKKLQKNKLREWQKPDASGVCEHKRGKHD